MTVRSLALLGLLGTVLVGCDDSSSDGPDATTTTTGVVSPTTGTTTTTHTTTTSQSSTTLGITTTSLAIDCFFGFDVVFSVTNTETVGALQYDTAYTAVDGSFDGGGGLVNCTRLAGEFAAFNDDNTNKRLASAFVSTAGFTGPIDIALCRFSCPVTLSPDDFVITITDQSKPDFSPANATVAVTRVERDTIPGSTTTLEATTTTTLSATTTSTLPSTTTTVP